MKTNSTESMREQWERLQYENELDRRRRQFWRFLVDCLIVATFGAVCFLCLH